MSYRKVSDTSYNHPRLPLTEVDPDDFRPINGVWSGPCVICGGKWVQYTEKFKQKQKDERRFSHKICQKCYTKAIAAKSLTFSTLPGILNMANMRQTNFDFGRSDVCNTGAAICIDQDTKQKICHVCYSREQTQTEA